MNKTESKEDSELSGKSTNLRGHGVDRHKWEKSPTAGFISQGKIPNPISCTKHLPIISARSDFWRLFKSRICHLTS